MTSSAQDTAFMQRALELAANGQGRVEPNPMVGCVIVQGDRTVGEGFHTAYGEPHAEAEALRQAGSDAVGATMYVTLEPCCHFGKTPPCTKAIIAAGIAQLVVAGQDPFKQVDGGGIAECRKAGIDVRCGVHQIAARALNAPYFKRVETGRPWVLAKWAMTLDGKIATSTGDSQWISSESSRRIVHELRGRVDAIMVGRGTAVADDPLLTARPPGPRTALRIVVDTDAALPTDSQLVQTASQTPVLVAASRSAPARAVESLQAAGCEVVQLEGEDAQQRLSALLDELGRRDVTNLLVEGGGQILGSLLDLDQIDEVHTFIAPILAGGCGPSPIQGTGIPEIAAALRLENVCHRAIDNDTYLSGRLRRSDA